MGHTQDHEFLFLPNPSGQAIISILRMNGPVLQRKEGLKSFRRITLAFM